MLLRFLANGRRPSEKVMPRVGIDKSRDLWWIQAPVQSVAWTQLLYLSLETNSCFKVTQMTAQFRRWLQYIWHFGQLLTSELNPDDVWLRSSCYCTKRWVLMGNRTKQAFSVLQENSWLLLLTLLYSNTTAYPYLLVSACVLVIHRV